ncbi:hypothetical protein [Pedococcus sp. P5_B7]
MSIDQRLARAMRRVADEVLVPQVDLTAVRSAARAHRIRRASVVATAAAAVVLVAATSLVGGRGTSAPQPATTPDPQSSTSSSRQPSLLTYRSSQYDLTLQYPKDWTPNAAIRAWSWTTDVKDWRSPAHDWFKAPEDSPTGDVRVSVWNAPLDPDTRQETYAYLLAWVEDYCVKSGDSPCTGIDNRAIQLCLEPRDCHPGLLVPFDHDVLAFFGGGDSQRDAMTIVAVWRPEWDDSVRPYGGARKLLEAFLATMDVRPNTRPS